jgi:hypothetical protein
MSYTADQVWGTAVAIHRINGGYFKEDQWMHNATPPYLDKRANKTVVKEWLKTSNFVDVTQEDIARGQEVRRHFQSYMMLALKGQLNDFQREAFKISQLTEFGPRDHLAIAITSCLPSVYERDRDRKEFMDQIRNSTQLAGEEGDKVQGEIVVLSSRYNMNYNKWKISAKMVDSFVDFWYNTNLNAGDILRVKGKVKAQRSNNTTQLHYVKVIG